jgi:hypothetical protein
VIAWYAAVWIFYMLTGGTSGEDWAFYYHGISVAPACLLIGMGFDAVEREAANIWRAHARHLRKLGRLAAASTVAALIITSVAFIRGRDERADLAVIRDCALEFATQVPPAGRIVVAGVSTPADERLTTAWNDPSFFAWMDRKGFSYSPDELDVALLDHIAARGGRYWIARSAELARPALKSEVDARFTHVGVCQSKFHLYDLAPS